MPTGVIINSAAIVIGGIIGNVMGERLSQDFKTKLNMVFGACSFTMGISSIALMENMPAVVFAVILGTAFGLVVHLGEHIENGARLMQKGISKIIPNPTGIMSEEEYMQTLITIIVLFCSAGTGIYGSIVSGMNGDHSILIAKSILDLPTALIFGCSLGAVVAFIAIPQFIIFMLLFILAGIIFPLTTPTMINDFKACGGVILFATGFRMIKVKDFPTADMIPSMILVMPVSWLWTSYILPLVSR